MNKIARPLLSSLAPARAFAVAALAVALLPGTAQAEKADRDKPTNVEANQMFYDEAKMINTFVGNVVLTRGTLVMQAEKLIVKQDAAGNQFATMYAAPGSMTKFRQKRDGGKDLWIEGYAADRIEYDTKTEIAKLFKAAKVKMLDGSRVTDEVEGEFIQYDSRAEFYTVNNSATGESKPGGGRVKAVMTSNPVTGQTGRAASQLRVRSLQKSYGARQVVRDVSLDVSSGEVIGLLGPNGAGKTTSFYMIVGLVPSEAGDIMLDGDNISSLPIHQRAARGLSYLPQEASVFRKLSVEDNIRAVLELQKPGGKPLSRTEIEQRLDTLLAELQIEKLRDNPALSLSGGERRRVEIARALATSPRFILLDEPFAGVDPIAVIEIQRIVRFLKERGIGVLITDHNVRETLGICDRAYIINQGSVLASGSPDEIIGNESVRRVYLGEHFRM